MRVERAKNKEVDKPNVHLNKNESSIFNSSNQLKTINSPPPSANGVFAKILDEAKKDAKTGRSERTAEKSSENTPESTKFEKDVSRQTKKKTSWKRKKATMNKIRAEGKTMMKTPSQRLFLIFNQLQNQTNFQPQQPVLFCTSPI